MITVDDSVATYTSTTRRFIRFARLDALLTNRRHARLARYGDPSSAEDDYYRFANRSIG